VIQLYSSATAVLTLSNWFPAVAYRHEKMIFMKLAEGSCGTQMELKLLMFNDRQNRERVRGSALVSFSAIESICAS